MKATTKVTELRPALSLCRAASNPKGALAGSFVELSVAEGWLILRSTDLSLQFRTRVQAEGTEYGGVLAPLAAVARVVDAIGKGSVDIEASDDRLSIRAGNMNVSLPTWPVSDMPPWPAGTGEATPLDPVTFRDALARIIPVLSRDETRPVLTRIQVLPGELAATDSYRAAIVQTGSRNGLAEPAYLGGKAARILTRMLKNVYGFVCEHKEADHWWRCGEHELYEMVSEGRYPSIATLIPDSWAWESTVNRAELSDVLQQLTKAIGRKHVYQPLVLQATDALALLWDDDAGTTITHSVAIEGKKPWRIGVNPTFLDEGLRLLQSESIRICGQSALRPLLLAGGEDSYLLMPIRINY